ncbi:hypothetical protein N7474_010501 [Penicillium riverlandense]|uniref:uncharacterized protein n=1 Tax=Penicillium riverlandense TaxID=1903569 RepID=UPI0025484D56|nr:uncharacterized protein N7474_010501 [Penicillium riverlandense]KAJ5806909.1 hypothetical protein N7474_010501 [Penicillium riverlandense]
MSETHDSEEDLAWEDVPIRHKHVPNNPDVNIMTDPFLTLKMHPTSSDTHPVRPPPDFPPGDMWVAKPISLPPQREQPIPAGSDEETQTRNRLEKEIEKVIYRASKTRLGIRVPNAPPSQRAYETYKELALDMDKVIDKIWACGTASLQIWPLLGVADQCTAYLKYFCFDSYHTLWLFNKLDVVFSALITGVHPLTGDPLPGSESGQPLVNQTLRVRIRSVAERGRATVMSRLPDNQAEELYDPRLDFPDASQDEIDFYDRDRKLDFNSNGGVSRWYLESSAVYVKTITLLGDNVFSNETQ